MEAKEEHEPSKLSKLLAVLLVLGIVLAAAVALELHKTDSVDQAKALETLRALNRAQKTYLQESGEGRYGSLEDLVAEVLVSPTLRDGVEHGYRFEMVVEEKDPGFSTYIIHVSPEIQQADQWNFYSDHSATVRAVQGRRALQTDPAICRD